MKTNFETYTYKVPTEIATSLINDDVSGLEDDDIKCLEKFRTMVYNQHGHANFSYDAENNNESFSSQNDFDNKGANCIELTLLVAVPYTKIDAIIENELNIRIRIKPCEDNIRDSFDSDVITEDQINKIYFKSMANDWYWCNIEVLASWGNIHVSDDLGACSYESEDDFKKTGYYLAMKTNCKDRMKVKLETLRGKK